jgi:hypothetical protein
MINPLARLFRQAPLSERQQRLMHDLAQLIERSDLRTNGSLRRLCGEILTSLEANTSYGYLAARDLDLWSEALATWRRDLAALSNNDQGDRT